MAQRRGIRLLHEEEVSGDCACSAETLQDWICCCGEAQKSLLFTIQLPTRDFDLADEALHRLTKKQVAFFFALVFLAYAFAWWGPPKISPDSHGYLEVAQMLSRGAPTELPLRLPGYPALLAITGSAAGSTLFLFLVQLGLCLGSAYLMASLLVDLEISRRAIIAFTFLASLPQFVHPAAFVLTEALTLCLLTAGTVLTLKYCLFGRSAIGVYLASLCFGLCSITRPDYRLHGIAIGLVLLALASLMAKPADRPRFRKAAIAAILGPVLFSTALAGYYQMQFGRTASPLAAMAILDKMARYVESIPEHHEPFRSVLLRHRDATLIRERHHLGEGYIHNAMWELEELSEREGRDLSEVLSGLAKAVVVAEPLNYGLQAWKAGARFWEWSSELMPRRYPHWATGLLVLVHFGLVLSFGLAVAAWILACSCGRALWSTVSEKTAAERRRMMAVGVLLAPVFLGMGIHAVAGVGLPRYRIPSDFLVLAVVVLAASQITHWRIVPAEKTRNR